MECIFLGYLDGGETFGFWNLITKRCIGCSDVVFNEYEILGISMEQFTFEEVDGSSGDLEFEVELPYSPSENQEVTLDIPIFGDDLLEHGLSMVKDRHTKACVIHGDANMIAYALIFVQVNFALFNVISFLGT